MLPSSSLFSKFESVLFFIREVDSSSVYGIGFAFCTPLQILNVNGLLQTLGKIVSFPLHW